MMEYIDSAFRGLGTITFPFLEKSQHPFYRLKRDMPCPYSFHVTDPDGNYLLELDAVIEIGAPAEVVPVIVEMKTSRDMNVKHGGSRTHLLSANSLSKRRDMVMGVYGGLWGFMGVYARG